MKLLSPSHLKLRRQSGLTLVEILVASALLLVIALGLTAMLFQTQRAFRGGVKQVDVMESGRAALDMIAHDISHAAASQSQWSLNFSVGMTNGLQKTINDAPGGGILRSNYLNEIFVLNHSTNWQGIGFRVLNPIKPNDTTFVGVGTLYRFWTNSYALNQNDFFYTFADGSPTNLMARGSMRRVIDGVVHLSARAFDASGRQIKDTNVVGQIETYPMDVGQYAVVCKGPALPAMVELEIGILDPAAYEQLKPLLSTPLEARAFIQRNAGKIHIIRQQIPIRVARQ